MAEAARPPSPLVQRRQLGTELRELREASGLGLSEVAVTLELSASTLSRIENGRSSVRLRDVRFLLDVYGVESSAVRSRLESLARGSQERGWWHSYGDLLVGPLVTYVGLESAASSISEFQSHVFPGLLQSPAYARAVLRMSYPDATEEQLDRLVSFRLARQEMAHVGQTHHSVIVDEGVLMRSVGGMDCLTDQIRFVLGLVENPRIRLQVVEFSAGEHPAVLGGFTLLSFDSAKQDPVVFLETLFGGMYVERDEDVARYFQVFERLRTVALDEDSTRKVLESRLRELEADGDVGSASRPSRCDRHSDG